MDVLGEAKKAIRFESGENPSWSVIGLHGLGADGNDLVPVARAIAPSGRSVRFVLPHAPVRGVTINGGASMPAWFDVYGLDRNARVDQEGLQHSTRTLRAVIRAEAESGIGYDKIILFGFSQGGALALHAALSHEKTLGGVAGLSTYLLGLPSVESMSNAEFNLRYPIDPQTPLFLAHGTEDPVVPFSAGEQSMHALKAKGLNPVWRFYPMTHAICEEELCDLAAWLRALVEAGSA